MRFIVITDLHQKRSAIRYINKGIEDNNVNIALFLGDVTDFGSGPEACDIISKINAEVYAIPGNCDPIDFPDAISSVAVNMHCKEVNFGGYKLVGLGGSNITIFKTVFELSEDEIYNSLKDNSSNGMILMTHVPSYGILDKTLSGLNVGSPSVKKIVDEFHPLLALSGHVHEAIGIKVINGTTFVNPGPAKDGHYAIVDINNKEVNVRLANTKNTSDIAYCSHR